MKFSVVISKSGEGFATMSGFVSIQDAARTVLALAEARRGTDLFIGIHTPGNRGNCLAGLCCDRTELTGLQALVENADRALKKVKSDKKRSRERHKFLLANGGYGGPLYMRLFATPDDVIKNCFFGNDFEGVLKRLQELASETALPGGVTA